VIYETHAKALNTLCISSVEPSKNGMRIKFLYESGQEILLIHGPMFYADNTLCVQQQVRQLEHRNREQKSKPFRE
jgi:predicted metallo-beta-lactamase superfamily hydrolase